MVMDVSMSQFLARSTQNFKLKIKTLYRESQKIGPWTCSLSSLVVSKPTRQIQNELKFHMLRDFYMRPKFGFRKQTQHILSHLNAISQEQGLQETRPDLLAFSRPIKRFESFQAISNLIQA